MTSEEAIERLKKRICNEGVNRADKTYHFCTDGCMYGEEECEVAIAIKAIEKQIRKKPNTTHHNICIVYRCPICDKLLTTYYPGMNIFVCDRTKFCDDCGQRIDWSEENDKRNSL